MSTTLPPPTRPPMGSVYDLNLDDLKDKFWTIVLDELEKHSALLSEDCEEVLRDYISTGAEHFLETPAAQQNLTIAMRNLRRLIGEMVAVAGTQREMAATAGGARPILMIDREVFHATLKVAKHRGWSFWPFN